MSDFRLRALRRAAALGDEEAQAALARASGRRSEEEVAFAPWRELQGGDPAAPVSLSDGALRALEAELAPLGVERVGRALDFVRDGGPAGILDELAGDGEAAGALGLGHFAGHGGLEAPPRPALATLSGPALLRYGLLALAALAPVQVRGSGYLPDWLSLILVEGTSARVVGSGTSRLAHSELELSVVGDALEAAGQERDLPLRLLLRLTPSPRPCPRERGVEALRGVGLALGRGRLELTQAALRRPSESLRAHVLDLLERLDVPLESLWDEVFGCAADRSPALQRAAWRLIRARWSEAEEQAEAWLGSAEGERRALALELLGELGDPRDADLRERLRAGLQDRSPAARAAAGPAELRLAERAAELPRGLSSARLPVPTREAYAALRSVAWGHLGDAPLADAWRRLSAGYPWQRPRRLTRALPPEVDPVELLRPFAEAPGVELAHVLRAACLADPRWLRLRNGQRALVRAAEPLARIHCAARGVPLRLDRLAEACSWAGISARLIGCLALEPPREGALPPFSLRTEWEPGTYYEERQGLVAGPFLNSSWHDPHAEHAAIVPELYAVLTSLAAVSTSLASAIAYQGQRSQEGPLRSLGLRVFRERQLPAEGFGAEELSAYWVEGYLRRIRWLGELATPSALAHLLTLRQREQRSAVLLELDAAIQRCGAVSGS